MRRRVILAIAAVAAAAVVLFAVPLALVVRQTYRDQELVRLQRDTVAATRAIDLSASSDPVELPPTRDRLAVYDLAGRRLHGLGPARADASVQAALRTGRLADATGGGRLVVAVPLLERERVTGAVRAQRSDAGATRDTRGAWLALAALAAVVAALAALAAILLGRRLARPLERLAGAARRLGDGNFAAPAPRAGIAEADAIATALDSTACRLDELVSRERAFSADASHQLRTPLAGLRLELEAMQLRGEQAPELATALSEIDRLEATIDTLLAVARDVPRDTSTTDLAAVIDEAEARWRGPLAADGRPVRSLVQAPRPLALVSAAVLGEALDVLIGNAHRHGAGAVTLTVRAVGDWLAVDVADDGPGLPDDPEAAFVRRTGAEHGIGLALARSLIHAEGGRLTVTRATPRPILTILLRPASPAADPAPAEGVSDGPADSLLDAGRWP
ncbi:MAG TPA: HAMP domain-containing sensor histidine kinase [Solirubrobacteraceae bacterium]|nr:HAMP domain-containing sensor histidine kinase [Solirubrobacteraceae bacterium]